MYIYICLSVIPSCLVSFGVHILFSIVYKIQRCCCMSLLHITEDFTEEARLFVWAIYETGERFGLGIPIQVLSGSTTTKFMNSASRFRVHLSRMKSRSALSNKTLVWLRAFSGILMSEHLIEPYVIGGRFKYQVYRLTEKGRNLRLDAKSTLPPMRLSQELQAIEHKESFVRSRMPSLRVHTHVLDMTSSDRELLRLLQDLRKIIADQKGISPFMVLDRTVLLQLVKQRPLSMEAFSKITGVSEAKFKEYGNRFVSVIVQFCASLPPREESQSMSSATTSTSRTLSGPTFTVPNVTETLQRSLQMFKSGLTVSQIAQQRGLRVSSVCTHLAGLIMNGYVCMHLLLLNMRDSIVFLFFSLHFHASLTDMYITQV